jgi:hypothetical protein
VLSIRLQGSRSALADMSTAEFTVYIEDDIAEAKIPLIGG